MSAKVDNVIRALVTPTIPPHWSESRRYGIVAALMEALRIDEVAIVATIGLPPGDLRAIGT